MNQPNWGERRDAGAIQFMLLDIIANLLTFPENPKEMGAYLTQQIRELVGAKRVILLQAQGNAHRIVNVEPKRHWDSIPFLDLDCLARATQALDRSTLWRRGETPPEVTDLLGRAEIESLIASPLRVGTKWTGTLLVADLAELPRVADNLDILDVLSPVVALVLRNAGFFEAQEEEIEARTQELARSERTFRTLAEVAPVGIFRLDVEGNFRFANDRMRQITGAAGTIPDSEHWTQVLRPEDRLIVETGLGRTLATGEPFCLEFRLLAPSGAWTTVLGEAVAERDEDGTITGFIGTLTDLTERKQAEEERRKLDERMGQVQKLEALGVLVAGVAHNINNVLAAIMATASLREMMTTEGRDLEAYRLIDKACKRGRDVVKSLMQFAKPTLSNQAPLELQALITEVRVLLENTTRNRIRITEVLSAEPAWIRGDAGNLNHALMNLCLNALDAMPAGGDLILRTVLPDQDWVELSVEDCGEGMAPAILARATEPFFTTKEIGKGTGLGLSMTHGVIKAHGGTLDITSAPGQGTTVRLRLPRIPAPVLEQPSAAPLGSLGPRKVLLVDDDADIRFLVARMLKAAGLQVKSVAGGEEALECLRAGALPDLIILDQNMPGMNGIQTMERIRILNPEVLILVSSGQPDIEEWACFQQPKVAVLSKPFEMSELLTKLARFPADR